MRAATLILLTQGYSQVVGYSQVAGGFADCGRLAAVVAVLSFAGGRARPGGPKGSTYTQKAIIYPVCTMHNFIDNLICQELI